MRYTLRAKTRFVSFICTLITESRYPRRKKGYFLISQQSLFALASIAYHNYEGLALNEDEKGRLVADLGNKGFMILRNHGLLTLGKTPAEAFLSMYILESACRIQILAQSGGAALLPVPQPIVEGVAAQLDAVTVGQGAQLAWPGLFESWIELILRIANKRKDQRRSEIIRSQR